MHPVRYHLRPQYLHARVRKLAGYALERLFADHYVTNLVRDCAPGGAEVPPLRRAA